MSLTDSVRQDEEAKIVITGLSTTMVGGGSCGLLRPGLCCCWDRTMLLHRRPTSQSAQECGRGSHGNNVQRSWAVLGPTHFCLLLLSSRTKQENGGEWASSAVSWRLSLNSAGSQAWVDSSLNWNSISSLTKNTSQTSSALPPYGEAEKMSTQKEREWFHLWIFFHCIFSLN